MLCPNCKGNSVIWMPEWQLYYCLDCHAKGGTRELIA
jgi:hypothetical protein